MAKTRVTARLLVFRPQWQRSNAARGLLARGASTSCAHRRAGRPDCRSSAPDHGAGRPDDRAGRSDRGPSSPDHGAGYRDHRTCTPGYL
jgi:hypothetical protein